VIYVNGGKIVGTTIIYVVGIFVGKFVGDTITLVVPVIK
jgi:hypothetical protein